MIPEEAVITFVETHKEIISSLKASFFEMSVAMALHFFAMEKVDVAVIEVGLGGRLDSTNIITPLLSVITNIGHDHMDLLGNTLSKIAAEKAGIIKQNVPVIVGEKQKEIINVFLSRAEEMSAPLSFASDIFLCTLCELDISDTRKFRLYEYKTGNYKIGISPLGGNYQSRNIPTVAASTDILKRYFPISNENLFDGIENVVRNTGLKGRWQILGKDPLIVCDTGHNREGLEFVSDQLKKIKKSKFHIVLGFVNDKDLSSVLPLFPADAIYYFTRAAVPRALDENILMKEASKYHLEGRSFPEVKKALAAARSDAGENDIIFIGGSTFVVAEII
jgi:dihydrofolate synthase/folylpolyglutamate synthase